MSKYDYERTYGSLERETATVDLSDPETQSAIRDISRREYRPYKQIHNFFYLVWILASAVGIITAFFLGTIAYR